MPTTPENMKQRITGNMCDDQSASVKKCTGIEWLQCCINANGHHFEHF